MPVFLSFFPKNRHFEMGSNCDVLTLKRTSFSTFFVVGRSNHLPTTSAFFRQIPSVSIYTKKLEMQLSARARGFESHRFRHQSLENSMFSRLFLLFGQHLFWGKQFKWCPWCPALWCPAHSTSYTLYKKDVYCGAPMVPGTAKKC